MVRIRSNGSVAMQALSEYLDWRIPQIEDLKSAVSAADQNDFASDDEVRTAFARHSDPKRVARERNHPRGGS